jgi:hypothetical protein
VQGDFFLVKKPLNRSVSVKSKIENAVNPNTRWGHNLFCVSVAAIPVRRLLACDYGGLHSFTGKKSLLNGGEGGEGGLKLATAGAN